MNLHKHSTEEIHGLWDYLKRFVLFRDGSTTATEAVTFNKGVTINESGADSDTRVEGDTATSLLVVDAGLEAVQIGTTTAGAIADFRPAEVVINDGGLATLDFRVESDAYDALFVDASNDSIDIMHHASGKVGFYAATPVVKQAALTAQLTTITYTEPGAADYAIQDLVYHAGIYGFADTNEAQTVLKVIANLQTRVAQLEARLQAYGLLP